ncbi:MAG: Uma2 family endonuclease [Bacillota bacterium]|nr:Uma2 family endonuclease [Bacillota bacterium]
MGANVPPAGEIFVTYEQYAQMPDDGRRYEILEGVLQMTPSPTTRHQRVSGNLYFIIRSHVAEHDLGEVFDAPLDVVLSSTCVLQPDLVFVSKAREQVINEKNIAGAPDLVVEIVSPATASMDRVTKAQVYARYGVPYYWVADPDQKTIEEFRLERGIYFLVRAWEGDAKFAPELFPGLEIKLSDVFTA